MGWSTMTNHNLPRQLRNCTTTYRTAYPPPRTARTTPNQTPAGSNFESEKEKYLFLRDDIKRESA
jgi:hypothetical protein